MCVCVYKTQFQIKEKEVGFYYSEMRLIRFICSNQ